MVVIYLDGKIYKICGNGLTYIGSTCQKLLSQRLSGHKSGYKSYLNGKVNYLTSFQCLTDTNCYIELLELCPCTCIEELYKCEGKWIRELDCVNNHIMGGTKKEYYELNKDKILENHKEYYELNKDKILENHKEWYELNKDKMLENQKQYNELNKDKIAEYNKQYHQLNKDKRNEKHRARYLAKKQLTIVPPLRLL
jgi:hypothetical protein